MSNQSASLIPENAFDSKTCFGKKAGKKYRKVVLEHACDSKTSFGKEIHNDSQNKFRNLVRSFTIKIRGNLKTCFESSLKEAKNMN